MAVHDGAAHLPEQLESLAAQSHRNWRLVVSDDRPGDGSDAAVRAFSDGAAWQGRVTCLTGPALRVDHVGLHDAWAYQLVTGAGGRMVHDDRPGLIYRQHEANQIGAADETRARMRRIASLLVGREGPARERTREALRATPDLLTPENRKLLEAVTRLRNLSLPARLRALRAAGLYRQSRAATLSLWLAAVLNRL